MKKSKKIVTLLMAFVLVLSLTACKAGVPSYDLEIDPETGAGTANFTIRVPKNDAPEVGNNFDKKDEAGYIESPEALLELFQDAVPDGFKVTMADEPKMVENEDGDEVDQGDFAYTLTFSFKGINDYNKKIMNLVGQSSWDGANESAKVVAETAGSEFVKIVPATMVNEVNGDKTTVTFTEDLRILDVIGYWAYSVITSDTTGVWEDLFPDSPATFENTINLDLAKYSVKFGDDTQQYRHSDDPIVTVKATVDAVVEDTAAEDTSSDSSNSAGADDSLPKTGDNAYAAFIFSVVAGLLFVSIIVVQRRVKGLKNN